jgi:RNA polymerase sigma-70 factor, ECF subfamily
MLNYSAKLEAHTGREVVFDGLFRAHYASVLRYALRRLSNLTAAEDVAAETFVVAWRRLDSLPADQLPWLFAIARHLILNERRSDRRRARLVARLSVDADDQGDGPIESSGEPRIVLAALARLGERDQEVLRLAAWEGLDPTRAAAVVGCSRGALAVRLHRARRRLAKQLTNPTDNAQERR